LVFVHGAPLEGVFVKHLSSAVLLNIVEGRANGCSTFSNWISLFW
jgi:hypothetical protein